VIKFSIYNTTEEKLNCTLDIVANYAVNSEHLHTHAARPKLVLFLGDRPKLVLALSNHHVGLSYNLQFIWMPESSSTG
jgi:hypothetical protein